MDQVEIKKGRAGRSFKWLSTYLCVFATLAPFAIAQRTTGALGGQVLDPQGAAIPNAKVSVTDQETGVVSNTVTSSAGAWKVPSVIPGNYSVSIQAQGFRTLLRRDVTVLADAGNATFLNAPTAAGLASIADPNFLNPKIFSGGNRQMTLRAKFVF